MFSHTYFLRGSIDFRGRKTADLDKSEIENVIQEIDGLGIRRVAVVGKFSNRNSGHEKQVRDMTLSNNPQMSVAIGSETAGQLNFLRRIVTTYYTVMTQGVWDNFIDVCAVLCYGCARDHEKFH
jgi:N-methylhydantoinase A/oxoprolinase/acetone carboxylase beta subunit